MGYQFHLHYYLHSRDVRQIDCFWQEILRGRLERIRFQHCHVSLARRLALLGVRNRCRQRDYSDKIVQNSQSAQVNQDSQELALDLLDLHLSHT